MPWPSNEYENVAIRDGCPRRSVETSRPGHVPVHVGRTASACVEGLDGPSVQ